LWRLAAMTGMRRGELLGLTWRALALESGRLAVDQQLIAVKGGVTFAAPKTARSRRTVALDADTVAALEAHQEAQLLGRAFAGEAYEDRDLVTRPADLPAAAHRGVPPPCHRPPGCRVSACTTCGTPTRLTR
jgi:integrase